MKLLTIFLLLIITSVSEAKWPVIDGGEWIPIDSVELGEYAYLQHGEDYRIDVILLDCRDSLNWIEILQTSFIPPFVAVRKTTDGGNTWNIISIDSTRLVDGKNRLLLSRKTLQYEREDLIVTTCDSGYYYKSTDGGYSWKENRLPAENNANLYRIDKLIMHGDIGYIRSLNGKLYKTENGADSWELIDLKVNKPISGVTDFTSPDEETIIAVTYIKDDPDSLWYYFASYDKGVNWNYLTSNKKFSTKGFTRMIFSNKKIGWGYTGVQDYEGSSNSYSYIWKTTDGGKKWELQYNDPYLISSFLYKSDAYDSLNFAVQAPLNVYKTTDGGKSWIKYFVYSKGIPISLGSKSIVYQKKDNPVLVVPPYLYRYYKLTGVESEGLFVNNPIFPNPASDYITLECEKPEDIKIVNALGVEQFSIDKFNGGDIDISSLTTGVYFVIFNNGNKPVKFVKR